MPVISIENVSKLYRLGMIGTGTLAHDLNRWWARVRGREDPYAKIGQVNDRTQEADGDYVWALKDIDLEVEQGEVLGIIGKNGAGKSTLLKLISRITAPTTGEIKAKGRVASLLEVGTGMHPEMTARENIYLNGAILGMKKREIAAKFDDIVDFAGCAMYVDTPLKRYSSGMKVRLGFAVAAFLEPDILIVDEVLAVGDAEFQKKAIGKMQDVSRESGRTILFVSHQMPAVENLCDRCILLGDGRLTVEGDTAKVVREYLNSATCELSQLDLGNYANRDGSGVARIVSFHMEDCDERRVQRIQSGDDVALVFGVQVNTPSLLRNVDVGFSLHSDHEHPLAVLYSSYSGKLHDLPPGQSQVRCLIQDLPFAAGRYRIGARLTASALEADWPREKIGILEVAPGDFYGSGKNDPTNSYPFLIRGQWAIARSADLVNAARTRAKRTAIAPPVARD